MKTWTVLCSEIYPNATALDRLQCNKWVAFKSIFVTVFQTECFFFFHIVTMLQMGGLVPPVATKSFLPYCVAETLTKIYS